LTRCQWPAEVEQRARADARSAGPGGAAAHLYRCRVIVQRHWWNGSSTTRARRDVYIRSDGSQWDVLVQIGGAAGRYRVQQCPSSSSAVIVADAWRGSGATWRELALPSEDGRSGGH
jgi:hypothetical protein